MHQTTLLSKNFVASILIFLFLLSSASSAIAAAKRCTLQNNTIQLTLTADSDIHTCGTTSAEYLKQDSAVVLKTSDLFANLNKLRTLISNTQHSLALTVTNIQTWDFLALSQPTSFSATQHPTGLLLTLIVNL